MTARSEDNGHEIEWKKGRWIYSEFPNKPVDDQRPCANCGRHTVQVEVNIAPDLNASGEWTMESKPIDACLADIVNALQAQGINMRGSCCAHGKGSGSIDLQDGRTLRIEWPKKDFAGSGFYESTEYKPLAGREGKDMTLIHMRGGEMIAVNKRVGHSMELGEAYNVFVISNGYRIADMVCEKITGVIELEGVEARLKARTQGEDVL